MNLREILETVYPNDLENLHLNRIEIVSPYVSNGFFEQLQGFEPDEVLLVADSGCSERDIAGVQDLFQERLSIRLATPLGINGIVHSKLFLFHWYNTINGRFRFLLLWGSNNATQGGFGRNAEVFSWAKLKNTQCSQEVRDYFTRLARLQKIDQAVLPVSSGVHIVLPGMRLANFDAAAGMDSFDLWLQKGVICHEYRRDNSFRFVRVPLNQPLPGDVNIENVLIANGFDVNRQTAINYDYLCDENFGDIEEDPPGHFIAQYFIDTIYGRWTPLGCYVEKSEDFYKERREVRRRHLELIKESNQDQVGHWVDQFIVKLESTAGAINNAGNYFRMAGGKIDTAYYAGIARENINRDRIKSREEWFAHSYINGLEFSELPPLREFSSNWTEFVISFCSALAYQINAFRTESIIARLLRDNEDVDFRVEDEALLPLLRNHWELIRDDLTSFYLADEP